jgi:RNA polymerase subunit RPABC4/transcription elongation factor Spt4
MVYKSIRTTSKGKALMCPHCDNEELDGGDYCKICGNEVVNRCADMCDDSDGRIISRGCHNILSGNARYCPHCGNESAFLQKGWLLDWRSENLRKALQHINAPALDINEIRAANH